MSSTDDRAVPHSHKGEHHGDTDGQYVELTRSAQVFALCAAVNSCNLGYDIGVSTNLGPLLQEDLDLTDVEREILIGSINFFSMFGALSSQYFSDRFGRRTTFLVAAVLVFAARLIMAVAPTYWFLMVGRAMAGLGIGVGFAIDPLYISEMSPARHRGRLVTWSEIGINVGIVSGFSMGLVLAAVPPSLRWRVMSAVGMLYPCIIVFLATKVLPETPRWLVLQGRVDEAKKVLYQVYPPGFNVDLVVEDIQEALERERLAEEAVGWAVFCHPTPAIRRMLLVGFILAIAQQAVGIDAIQYYLLDLMVEIGITDPLWMNLLLIGFGMVKLLAIVAGGRMLDTKGRRFVIFLSLAGLVFSLLLTSLSFTMTSNKSHHIIAVVGITLYLTLYGLGTGPVSWLVPSEIFATSIRAKANSVATFLNRATATVMVSTFLTVKDTVTWPGYFMILAGVCVFLIVFVYYFFPETKGRSLEDMSLYFAEITGDYSLLDAERKLRVEGELKRIKDQETKGTMT